MAIGEEQKPQVHEVPDALEANRYRAQFVILKSAVDGR